MVEDCGAALTEQALSPRPLTHKQRASEDSTLNASVRFAQMSADVREQTPPHVAAITTVESIFNRLTAMYIPRDLPPGAKFHQADLPEHPRDLFIQVVDALIALDTFKKAVLNE